MKIRNIISLTWEHYCLLFIGDESKIYLHLRCTLSDAEAASPLQQSNKHRLSKTFYNAWASIVTLKSLDIVLHALQTLPPGNRVFADFACSEYNGSLLEESRLYPCVFPDVNKRVSIKRNDWTSSNSFVTVLPTVNIQQSKKIFNFLLYISDFENATKVERRKLGRNKFERFVICK
jgi:hypothetical protein